MTWVKGVEMHKLLLIRLVSPMDIMNSMVTIVKNIVLRCVVKRVDLKSSHKKKKIL